MSAVSGKSPKKWNIWNGDRLPISLLMDEIYVVPKKQAVA